MIQMNQYTKLENIIAKAIHQDDLQNKVSYRWETWGLLPYHMKLSYIVQAKRMVRIIKHVREDYVKK